MNRTSTLSLLVLAFAGTSSSAAPPAVYRDPSASIERRANDLLRRMTLQEKVEQLTGDGSGMATADNTRLDIPGLRIADGPVGLRWGTATCFPSSLCMGATWSPDLVRRVAAAIGREFRARGRYVALGPCTNLIRDPRGGRSFETFGEDPCLVARMAAEYVAGMQGEKVIAVVKHYACNNQEDGRYRNDVQVGERTLREVYLPAFRACVDAGAWGVMAAYNSVNGAHCSENRQLLTDILRGEWGFRGFVVCDWDGSRSTAPSVRAGMDLEMPKPRHFAQPLLDAVRGNEVGERDIDEAVRRILRAKLWAGVFEEPVEEDSGGINTPEHQALAEEAARAGIVLLRNEGGLLPLDDHTVRSIAVIGPNADAPRHGGGGSSAVSPPHSVTVWSGLQRRVGESVVLSYAKGCDDGETRYLPPIPATYLSTAGSADGRPGLRAEYYADTDLGGEPQATRVDRMVSFDWGDDAPVGGLAADGFSVRWSGTLKPPSDGTYTLGVTADDGARLYLDGECLIDAWAEHSARTDTATVDLRVGHAYELCMDYFESKGLAEARLGWLAPGADALANAVAAAREADVAVVVVGTRPGFESEGHDRASLVLPWGQDELISAVARANPRTVVLVVSGSAVAMAPWIEEVPAALQCWFAGQEAGSAIAATLFGDCSPGGKLPITIPRDDGQLPAFDSTYETVHEGRGYRYYARAHVEPLFCFGHGLSYTRFSYGDLRLSAEALHPDETLGVAVDVTNTGDREGDEVVQLYLRDLSPASTRAAVELRDFRRLTLLPGQTTTVELSVAAEDLATWDEERGRFVLRSGRFELLVGSSLRDIRGRAAVEMTGK